MRRSLFLMRPAIKNEQYMTELDFGTELSPVKITLTFKAPVNPKDSVELYAVELLSRSNAAVTPNK